MDKTHASYACDKCRSRKVACSRERSGCHRCKDESAPCTYSRSGVIRRNRKRKHETLDSDQFYPSPRSVSHGPLGVNDSSLQSHLATDIAATRDRLDTLDVGEHSSLGALSSLSEACAAVWHDLEFDMTGKGYFLFEDRATSWVEVFTTTLSRGRPLMKQPPPQVLEYLRAARPNQVQDRAWLVMYYSIILSMVSSINPTDKDTKAKLRCNLWLAFNDVRLLLEPSEVNIQALVLLACHVEEFTTPSLCWMLTTNACRMLQALGINNRRIDSETRERRTLLFWHLNLLDKGLALIFGRPPTFHPAMAKELALPTLGQLLQFQPHISSSERTALFGAHYIYQMMALSRLMTDIWDCLYGDVLSDEHKIESVIQDLDSWQRQAQQLLDAAALAEKPFLDARGARSIDLGLRNFSFQYHYMLILLSRSSSQRKRQSVESSKHMLHLLEDMVSDSEESYNGIVWHLVCSPFTAFLALFGEILSNNERGSEEHRDALIAMEKLPVFLRNMGFRNSLAAKLERTATVLVQHARTVVQSQDNRARELAPKPRDANTVLPNGQVPDGNVVDWDAFLTDIMTAPTPDLPQLGEYDTFSGDHYSLPYNFSGYAFVDWLGMDNQF